MKLQNWAVAVTAAPRGAPTLGRTLASIQAAGFPRPRVFADGDVAVAEGYDVTRRTPAVGGWPNFWLAATELISRQPAADAYLIVQDDVVFCAGVFDYVSRFDVPEDCGVLSLFCPACHNQGLGWFTIPTGYGMASAQAFAFPRERMYEFLAHPWTVNHRRSAPQSEHFCGDGLHHIDGVVGEWLRLTGLACFCHSPSLSQHIGHDSAMYPGFEGKKDRRFADSFPGERVNANEVFVKFHRDLLRWTQSAASEEWTIPAALWARISGDLRPGMRTLETGSGLSTRLFVDAGCKHIALEHDDFWAQRLLHVFPECKPALRICRLSGEPPWYDWRASDEPYDLLLIDGPPGQIGRRGIERHIDRLIHGQTVIYVDDALRPDEAGLCESLQRRFGYSQECSSAGHHGFACLRAIEASRVRAHAGR
jgi:hypothetical protein